MKIKLIFAGIIVSSVALTSAYAADYPITVVDDRMVPVIFTEKPKNVAALSVVGADVMKALGETPIGIGTLGGVLPAYLEYNLNDYTDFGLVSQPNIELLTEKNVDLTVGITNYNAPFAEDFEKLGNLLTFNSTSFEDSLRSTVTMSQVFGKGEVGAQLNEEFIDLISNYQEKTTPGQTALFMWVWGDVIYAYYNETMQGSLIELLNVKNVMGNNINALLTKQETAAILDAEQLLRLDPDVIFALRAEGNNYKNNPVYRKLKAVKNNRIYHIGRQYGEPNGPIARELVFKEMAHILYPDIFEAPDMPEAARAAHLKFAD